MFNKSETMIQLKNITKSYRIWKDDFQVLKWIDLEVQSGEYISIMGPSGSGKSTLMNIVGLLDVPSSGEYYFENQRIDTLSNAEKWKIMRQYIGFIFQNYSLIPRINVLEQVKLPLIYQWVSPSKATKRAKEALKKVGLEGKEKSMPNEISWWQKQRVAVARALVIEPKIMLADEPTGALDTKTGDEIMDLFQELNEEGKTIILITHEKEIADRTQKTIHVRDGNIL